MCVCVPVCVRLDIFGIEVWKIPSGRWHARILLPSRRARFCHRLRLCSYTSVHLAAVGRRLRRSRIPWCYFWNAARRPAAGSWGEDGMGPAACDRGRSHASRGSGEGRRGKENVELSELMHLSSTVVGFITLKGLGLSEHIVGGAFRRYFSSMTRILHYDQSYS